MITCDAKEVIKKKYYFNCLKCKSHDFDISHLMEKGGSFGNWYCDVCGHGNKGTIKGKKLYLSLSGTINRITTVLLKRDKALYLVKGMSFNEVEDQESSSRYFYEEHTCPTNIFKNIQEEIVEGVSDVHGSFEYLGQSHDIFKEQEDDPIEYINRVFKEQLGAI